MHDPLAGGWRFRLLTLGAAGHRVLNGLPLRLSIAHIAHGRAARLGTYLGVRTGALMVGNL